MPVKRHLTLPAFDGVQVGRTATVKLPLGPRYHTVLLCGGDTAKDNLTSVITAVRIKVNGKVQRAFDIASLDAMNQLNGTEYALIKNATTGISRIPIFFAEPWRKDMAVQDGLAWGTGNLSTFQIEVDVAAGATGATLYAIAEVDNSSVLDAKSKRPVPMPMGIISKWYQQQIPINGLENDFTNLPPFDFYQQISLFDANITGVNLTVNSVPVRVVTKEENDLLLYTRNMVPVSTRFDLVLDNDDAVDSALSMAGVQDLRFHITTSSATPRNVASIIQRIGIPD